MTSGTTYMPLVTTVTANKISHIGNLDKAFSISVFSITYNTNANQNMFYIFNTNETNKRFLYRNGDLFSKSIYIIENVVTTVKKAKHLLMLGYLTQQLNYFKPHNCGSQPPN